MAVLIAKKRGMAEAQLAGTPSVLVDAIALALTEEDATKLAKYKPAIDFVSDAFAHLKAIAADDCCQALLDAAGVMRDDGVTSTEPDAFVKAARQRFPDREAKLW